MGSMFSPKMPDQPKPAPPPPMLTDPTIAAARARARRKAKAKLGFESTIATGARGVTTRGALSTPSLMGRSTLGGGATVLGG